jgi:hypothetical protein
MNTCALRQRPTRAGQPLGGHANSDSDLAPRLAYLLRVARRLVVVAGEAAHRAIGLAFGGERDGDPVGATEPASMPGAYLTDMACCRFLP